MPLTERPDADARARDRRAVLIGRIALALGVLLAVIALVLSLLTLLARQQANHQAQLRQQQILTILVNCTTPGHKCYDDGQKRTGALIKELEETAVLANLCAAHHPNSTRRELEACIAANRTAP
jgi:Na+-translocating ferredoxin:NAD+ oxidoreductase RnfG subunit